MTNGETIEHGVRAVRQSLGWTPELDECGTGGGIGCQSNFIFPDEEDKVQGVFLKNLDFALNVAVSAKDPEEPRNSDNNPSTYRVKPTVDIDADAVERQLRRHADDRGGHEEVARQRRRLGVDRPAPGSRTARSPRPRDAVRGRRATRRPAGQGVQRVRVTTPVNWSTPTQTARFATPGDIVSVTIRAGGQSQFFRYRVEAVPDTPPVGEQPKKRVLVSRRRTTPACRRTGGRATTWRRATCSRTSTR